MTILQRFYNDFWTIFGTIFTLISRVSLSCDTQIVREIQNTILKSKVKTPLFTNLKKVDSIVILNWDMSERLHTFVVILLNLPPAFGIVDVKRI